MSEYLPPVVAEIVLRTTGFKAGVLEAKADMAAASDSVSGSAKRMASDVDQAAGKVEGRTSRMASHVGGAMQSAGSAIGGAFGAPLAKVGEQMDKLDGKAKGLSGTLAEVGRVATIGGLAGFAGAAYEGVKAAASMQTSVTSIAASAGISQKAAESMGNTFVDTMGKSTFSGQEMAAAYAQVAGQLRLTEGHALSNAQAMQTMRAAQDLAEASQTNLGTATQALAGVMQAYHMSVGQAAGASNVLFNTSKAIGVPIEQVASVVERLHGRLGSLAPTLNDTATLMAELGKHGITGSRGVMVVNSALQTLVTPSKNVDAVLRDLGVHLYNSRGQFVGLQGAIGQLGPKLAALTPEQQKYVSSVLFGKSANEAMLHVMLDGVPAYQRAADAVSKHNAVQAAAAAQAHTLHGEWETLKATLDDLAVKFGNVLVPVLQRVASVVSSVIGWFEKHQAAAKALAAVIAGVLGAAIGAFVGQKVAALISGTQSMIKGFQDLAGGIGSTVASIVEKFTTMGAGEESLATTATTANEQVVSSFEQMQAQIDSALGLVDAEVATTATAVETADTAIEVANRAAGASFMALLGPIGLVATAVAGLAALNPFGGGGSSGNYSWVPNGAGGGISPGQGVGWTDTAVGEMPGTGPTWKRIAGFLAKQGFSKVAIAGILGNFGQENGGNTIGGISTGVDSGGIGIAQWIGSRATGLQQYAKQIGQPVTSIIAQLGFLDKELKGPYHNAFAAIQNASSPQAAAVAFEQLFEGAGKPMMQHRERLAAQAFQMLNGFTPASGMGATANGSGLGNSAIQKLLNQVGSGTTARHRSAAAKAIRALLYANPLPGMTSIGRTDQGVDFSATPGSAVDAVGAGRIVSIISNWFKGQPLVEEQLSAGPDRGKFVYYAEQLNPLVRLGQAVAAGQRIGTVATSGTGLELGFGAPGGRTLAMATTGYAEGQVTPAGQAFRTFYAQISKGVYETIKGGVVSGGGSNIALTISNAIQAYLKNLTGRADSLLTRLSNSVQNGSAASLEKVLGVSTSAVLKTPHPGSSNPAVNALSLALTGGGGRVGTLLYNLFEGTGTTGYKESTAANILARSAAGSSQGKAFNQQIVSLVSAGLTKLAAQLVAAHKAAMGTLATELYALQMTKDAETLALQTTQMRDQTTSAADLAKAQLQVTTDSQTLIANAMQAAAQRIADTTAVITAQFQGMAQSITDATQLMADSSNAIVQGITDQTQTQVDILGEKGLYGLNLLAQQQTVQLDVMKQGFDQQIAIAQQQVDATKAQYDAEISAAQINVAQTQLQQNALVAAAQQNADTVQLHADSMVAMAQAHVDAVQLAGDLKVQLAQMHVDLTATASKATQDAANAALKLASAQADSANTTASASFTWLQTATSQLTNAANNAYSIAQQTATTAENTAAQALATLQGQASVADANAAKNLQSWQDTAAQQEASLQGTIDLTNAQQQAIERGGGTFNPYSTLLLGAGGGLTLVNGGGPLPYAGAYSAGGSGGSEPAASSGARGGNQFNQTFNLETQADPQAVAKEIEWLLQPYLATA